MGLLEDILAGFGGGQPGQGTVLAPGYQPQAPPAPPPQQQQGGFGQTMGNIGSVLQNIGGTFVDVMGVISALDRGNLGAYQEQHRRALDDPAFQKTITPFQAGMYGQHLHSDPSGQLVPNLPPLSAQAQAEQGKAQYEAEIYRRWAAGDPSAAASLGYPMTHEQAKAAAAQAGVGTPGGPSRMSFKVPGGTETYGQTGGGLYEFPTFEEAQRAGAPSGSVPTPTNRGTWGIRARGAPVPGASVELGVPDQSGGQPAPVQGEPTPQPAPAPTAPPQVGPPTPDAEGYMDFGAALQQEQQPAEARTAYPSPAFVDPGGIVKSRTPPTAPAYTGPLRVPEPGAPAPPQAMGMPPGAQMAPAPTGPGMSPAQQIPMAAQPQARPERPPSTVWSVGGKVIPPPGPGETQHLRPSPDLTMQRTGPPIREEAAVQVRQQMLTQAMNLLSMGKGAVQRLVKKGVMHNGIYGSIVNYPRLLYASKQGDKDAAFLINNMRASVPLMARAMGEASRPNMREEQRLAESLGGFGISANELINIIDNYHEIITSGHAPAYIQQNYPSYAKGLEGGGGWKPQELELIERQQKFLEDAEPVGP